MGKRDRWDSSDDSAAEDENSKREASSAQARSAAASRSSLSRHGMASPEVVPPRHNPLIHGCRSVYETYDRISRVSEGTYGVVWKAKDLLTNEIVALKQVKFDADMTKDGFPVAALREISVLLALSHESIVFVREMVVGDGMDKVFMVMEFFEFDLKDGIERFEGPLFQGELKGIMQQILSATEYMHRNFYLHRDLKTSNILVHRSGRVALADFGLARRFQDPPQALTQVVVTLWYRAPELLFGETRYSTSIDLWSIGCIFGELICKDAILQGQGLFRWKAKEASEVLLRKKFPIATPVSGKQAFLDSNGYDLLSKLLTLDPAQRISAKDALSHSYFRLGVAPKTPRFFSSS